MVRRLKKKPPTRKSDVEIRASGKREKLRLTNADALRVWRSASPVKKWRESHELSSNEMAAALKITHSRWWQVENGLSLHSLHGLQENRPSMSLLMKMDEVFGDYPDIHKMRVWWEKVPSVKAVIVVASGNPGRVDARRLLEDAPRSAAVLDEVERGG